MRVLIDTNIFIHRENYHQVPKTLQELLRILNTLKVEIIVHPRSIDEIKNDHNEDRKNIALSKCYTYPQLESPPNPRSDESFLKTVGLPSDPHDRVDDALLYAVYRDAVDFLISEDKRIHNKAQRLNLTDRVFSSEEALTFFKRDFSNMKVKHPPALKEEYVYNLNVKDQFFDSIKEEYLGFEDWFRKVSREGRRCWVYFEGDNSINALLIFKVENESIASVPPLCAKKRLKLCTFKVEHLGHKIGELFVKLSVQYCVKNNIDEMYLTHFTKEDDFLANLLTEYGFSSVAKKDGEDVYLKTLILEKKKAKCLSTFEISTLYYPCFYDGICVKKFIVPIRPKYHDRLFIEYTGRQTTIPEHVGEFIVEGNTISKAYLSHSNISKISKADILLFYRSKDKMELTALGIVENVFFRLRDKDKVLKLVGKRTVYDDKEIEEIVKQPTLVILFKWHCYFPKPIKIDQLKKMGILAKAPQTITKIHHNKYLKIKGEGGLDERYTLDQARIL